jgi:hypothetical protein
MTPYDGTILVAQGYLQIVTHRTAAAHSNTQTTAAALRIAIVQHVYHIAHIYAFQRKVS